MPLSALRGKYIFVYISIHLSIYISITFSLSLSLSLSLYIYIYIYIYIHIYIYTYTYIYMTGGRFVPVRRATAICRLPRTGVNIYICIYIYVSLSLSLYIYRSERPLPPTDSEAFYSCPTRYRDMPPSALRGEYIFICIYIYLFLSLSLYIYIDRRDRYYRTGWGTFYSCPTRYLVMPPSALRGEYIYMDVYKYLS